MLKSISPKFVNTDHTRFISNRYIGNNTRLIYDLMKHTESNDMPEVLILIDFEKVFESVSCSFINMTLASFDFSDDICTWFNIL